MNATNSHRSITKDRPSGETILRFSSSLRTPRLPIRRPAATVARRQPNGARRFGIGYLSFHLGGMRDFGLPLVLQLRLLKRNEITAALADKLRFVVRPWHRVLIFMAGSRTGRGRSGDESPHSTPRSKAFVVCMKFWLGLTVRYRLPRRKRVESPWLELVRNLLLGGPLRLDHLVFPFSPSSTRRRMASNGRPHRLEPRRSESDCRMLLFTSTLDPTMMKQPAQHQLTRRNGQVSDDLPIVDA